MPWRVALIDSCGDWPGATASAFATVGEEVVPAATVADPSGHGTAIAEVLTGSPAAVDLLLGQVFLAPGPTTGAVVAAAVDWAVLRGAQLLHLSLGLAADRSVLRGAVERALRAGCVLVASTPARGAPVYPAAYPGVIRATGDARCGAGQWTELEPGLYGGCPRRGDATTPAGASFGAAWISRAICGLPPGGTPQAVMRALGAGACYRGRERRAGAPAD